MPKDKDTQTIFQTSCVRINPCFGYQLVWLNLGYCSLINNRDVTLNSFKEITEIGTLLNYHWKLKMIFGICVAEKFFRDASITIIRAGWRISEKYYLKQWIRVPMRVKAHKYGYIWHSPQPQAGENVNHPLGNYALWICQNPQAGLASASIRLLAPAGTSCTA